MGSRSATFEPRPGFAGAIDRFIGPGATSAELALQLIPLPLAAYAAYAYVANRLPHSTVSQRALAALLGADILGGILTNATAAAKRWYHRPGQGAREHLSFVFVHMLHVAAVAWVFRGRDVAFFVGVSAALLISATIVATVPLYVQRPIALGIYAAVNVVDRCFLSPSPGLEWFLGLFFLKLIIAHLLKETAYEPGGMEAHGKDR